MGGVELAGKFARVLLLDGAQGFEQGEGVIGQDDGFGVVGVLLALNPTRVGQATDKITGVIRFGFLTRYRNGIRADTWVSPYMETGLTVSFLYPSPPSTSPPTPETRPTC